ncbi:MAG: thioredoxin domain-containing protein [Oceanisphaera sp.]|uniref:thioredoxin domain-containing protein n=1 Tax=Oceanisphaera sp. TaxID=1929979 RepID=UPI003F9D5860
MQSVTQQDQLDCLLAEHSAVLVLYGGQACGVCQAIKPALTHLLAQEFPCVTAVYVDCQQQGGSVCAQQGVMALPVVHIWFEGRCFAEFFKVFSLTDIRSALTRPYQLLFAQH